MNIYDKDGVMFIHITEVVNGKRKTHDREATDEEIAEYEALENNKLIEEDYVEYVKYHTDLDNSDWVVTKINEAYIKGGDTDSLKVKYAEELTYRDTCRSEINLLEEKYPDFKNRYKG